MLDGCIVAHTPLKGGLALGILALGILALGTLFPGTLSPGTLFPGTLFPGTLLGTLALALDLSLVQVEVV